VRLRKRSGCKENGKGGKGKSSFFGSSNNYADDCSDEKMLVQVDNHGLRGIHQSKRTTKGNMIALTNAIGINGKGGKGHNIFAHGYTADDDCNTGKQSKSKGKGGTVQDKHQRTKGNTSKSSGKGSTVEDKHQRTKGKTSKSKGKGGTVDTDLLILNDCDRKNIFDHGKNDNTDCDKGCHQRITKKPTQSPPNG
jgi:hypothetical protein